MSRIAFAAVLPLLLLAACAGGEGESAQNGAAAAGTNAGDAAVPAGAAQPDMPAGNGTDPVPPPDAVSHPEGYLPPAPDEPVTTNASPSDPDRPPPATEDEYIRNRQAGS